MLAWLRRAREHNKLYAFYRSGAFNRDTEQVREAVRLGIEVENARIYFAPSAVVGLAFFYGLALALIGFALRIGVLWPALTGVVLGLIIAFTICSYPIFAKIEDMTDVKGRQLFLGVWIKLAMMVGALAGVVGAVRLFFR